MYNIQFFFKLNTFKNKKKTHFEYVGNLFLLNYIFKNSEIKYNKIYTNKYVMIKSPFHYKVSKKILYNKQSIISINFIIKKKLNPYFFENYFNFNSTNFNIFKIKCFQKKF